MKLQYITIPIELFESLMFGIETYMAQAGSLAEGYAKILAQKEAAIKAGGSCWLSVSHEAKCSAVKELRK